MSDAEESPVRPDAPRRHPLVLETSLAVVLGLLLFGLGNLAYYVVVAGGASLAAFPRELPAVFGWRTPIWIVATMVIAVLLRHGTLRRRMRWGIGAAALAAVAGIVLEYGPYFAMMGPAILLGLVPWLLGIASFVVCIALGWLITARIVSARPAESVAEAGGAEAHPVPVGERGALSTSIAAVLLVAGGVGILALAAQWFGIYFRIWSPAPRLAEFGPEGVRYLVTAAITCLVLAAALVVALVRRNRGMIVFASIMLPVALVAAFVFEVPVGRFWPEPTSRHELPADYTPCFGGLDDPGCEGG